MSTQPDANALLVTGRKYFAKKSYKEALEAWKAAQNQYQKTGQKREFGVTSIEIAKALIALGREKEALVSCTQAVRILREVNDRQALREALLIMGHLLDKLGFLEEGIRALNQAVEIQISGEDALHRISIITDIARMLMRGGKYHESSARFVEALKIVDQIDNSELRGEILAEYAQSLQYEEEHDKAERVLKELITLWNTPEKHELRGYAHLGLASTYIAKGLLEKAEIGIQQAQNIFLKTSDAMGSALTEYHSARLLLEQGKPEQALPHGEAALNAFQEQKNQLAYAEAALVVAQILVSLVQDVRALRLFDKANEIFSQLREEARKQKGHIQKGVALLQLGQQKQAEHEFAQVIRYYQETKQVEQEARVYLQIGKVLNQSFQYSEALEQTKNALRLLPNMEEERLVIQAYRLMLEAAKNASKLADEVPFAQETIKNAKAQGKALLASVLTVYLALYTLDTQQPDQLKNVLESAIHDEKLPIELRAKAALNLGTVFLNNSQFTEAAQYLSQAIKEFESEPNFDKSRAYYQLAKAYRHLEKPKLQKDALIGALQALDAQNDKKIQGQLLFELAPLIEVEENAKALEYYEKAGNIFYEAEQLNEYLQTLLKQANLRAEASDFSTAIDLITRAITVAEELDIPIDFKPENLPIPWTNMQHAIEEAIHIGAHQYHKQRDRAIVDKIIDWSGPRKIALLHPFLADNLGFERCAELAKLFKEEKTLMAQTSDLKRQLAQLLQQSIPEKEYLTRRTQLRDKLKEAIEKINVNRNVIAAACQDPGRGMLPTDYKMPQKLSALMPPDRRWILINYDVLIEKQRIVITTIDHIGRHNIHTLPISHDLESAVQKLQFVKASQNLPSIADLKDIASFLYRSLIPSLLERELQNHNYGFLQFITDGFLNNVPFELIFDGREFWGLKYPMAWAPDFQFFESTLKTKALAPTGTPSVILGVSSDSVSQTRRKELTEEIIQSFLSAVPTRAGVTEPIVLFGRDFTRNLLSSNLDQPRSLLYFATPTTLHYRKGEISLQQPDSLRIIEIGVTTNFIGAPIIILDESVRLEPRFDGLSLTGFLRHLAAAGSPSIVFTRWRPQLQLQPTFTQAIINQLYDGDPIAVAMLHTRRKLATKGQSPISWLSYSLCGNPFSTLI